MRLGEMLLRDGRIAEQQLAEAIAVQARDGGRLGSVLVELGFIDAETLTVYLGNELGLPIATGATLERCKRSAVRLLKPEQAARFRCIPIVIQGQTLIVAMDDPHDLMALDALAAITGYRVIPRVAPEIRVFYYLERFYGVKRPPRFRKLGHTPRGSKAIKPEHKNLPAPPLPGLPPMRDNPGPTPDTPPVVHSLPPRPEAKPPRPPASMPPPIPVTSADEALAEAEGLVVELEADEGEVAAPAEAMAAIERTAPRARTVEEIRYQPLGMDEALAAIAGADQRGAVADAVLGYLAGTFELGALLLVRDNMAFGWKGFGPNLDRDRVETLLVPLDIPSMFQVAVRQDHRFRGRAFPATIHNHLFKVLRCRHPTESIVVVIAIGRRAVNLVYAHPPPGEPLTDEQVEALLQVTAAAADAYVRMITVSKKKQKPVAGSS
jgi:hypothetical protein